MYKIVLVDDEPKVRRGLRSLIPQLDSDWSIIGEAKNGHEALDLIKKELPDLVITDIRMPHMNGLELLSELKEYPIYVVILSGYGFFEYAQTAVKYGAFDYLLKPLKPEDIQDVLGRVKLQKQSKLAEESGNPKHLNHSKLWKDWLMGIQDEPDSRQKLASLFQPNASAYRIMALEVDSFDDLITEDQWGDRQLVLFAVRNIIQDVVAAENSLAFNFLFVNGPQIYFLFIDVNDARNLATKFIGEVKKWVKICVSIGISDETIDFGHLPGLLQNACEALQNKWIYGGETVSEYEDFQLEDILAAGYPNELVERLTIAIHSCQQDTAKACLLEFVESVKHLNVSFRLFRRFCLQLVSSVIRIAYEHKMYDLMFKNLSRPLDLFEKNFTSDEYVQFMNSLISACITALEWNKEQKHNRSIEKSLEFIRNHYTSDISLEETARHVQMNTSYFSSYFKQEIGSSFVEYLTRLRMEKAKSLMLDSNLRLYEIAEMVGYQDVRYFSRIFKRSLGVTPVEYRQFFFRKED